MTARYFVLDTETSRLPPNAGVCEIGWVELDERANVIERVSSLIDPERPISASASGVHGIVDADVADKPTLAEFFSEALPGCYGRRLQADVVILIGHRVSFDRQFVEPYIDGEIQEVCTLRWARNLYPHAEDHKLSTLKYALGLPKDQGDAHRVDADVGVTHALLLHLMQRKGMTLPELAEASQHPMLLHTMFMGKHRGEPFSEIPHSYLRWMHDNLTDLDMDAIHTVKHYLFGPQT